jgi:hypothetical protein
MTPEPKKIENGKSLSKIQNTHDEKITRSKLHPAIIVLLRMASKESIKHSGHYGTGLNQAINNMLHDYGLTKEETEQIKKEINQAREEFEIYTV